MNNSSENFTFGFDAKTETISLIGIGLCSLSLDLATILTVVASRAKLINTEFFILILFNFMDVNNKIAILLYFYNSLDFDLLFALIAFSYSIVANFCITMNLFYYSIFHLSTLSRSAVFLKLFELVHRFRNFIIYEIVCVVFSFVLTAILARSNYLELREFISNPLISTLFFVKFSFQVICQNIIPCCLSLLMYISSMVFVFGSRLSDRHGKYAASASERRKFRRNTLLLVKFTFYACVNVFSTLPIAIFCIILLICPTCPLITIRFFAYFGFICFAIKSPSLVLLHNILRATFFSCLKRVF